MPTAARWLSEVMAEDRRYAGGEPDVDVAPPALHRRRLPHAMAGTIAGALVIGMAVNGSPGPEGYVPGMAAQANAASAPAGDDVGDIVIRGNGRAGEAALWCRNGFLPCWATEHRVPVSNQ